MIIVFGAGVVVGVDAMVDVATVPSLEVRHSVQNGVRPPKQSRATGELHMNGESFPRERGVRHWPTLFIST